jgi:membrane-associated phospholipid phosphatase
VIGSYGAVWIAIALAAVALRRRPATLVLTVVVAVFAADGLATGLKQALGRDRPYVERPDPEPLMDTHFDLGFPSGHAATSFAGATVLALALPRLAVPLYALATLIALSRVYVGVHYPGDILAGALLGAAVGAAVWALVVRRRRRPDQEPLPEGEPPRP